MKTDTPFFHLLFSVVLALAGFAIIAAFLPRPADLSVDAQHDLPFYSQPFGKNPFAPAEMKTADGKLVDWRGIPSARACGECHRQEFMEWATSLHAVSDEELVYATTVRENTTHTRAAAQHGEEKGRWCEACHNPLGIMSGAVTPLSSVPRTETMEEGVSCVACHTASHAEPLAGNGALTIRLNDIFRHANPALIMAAPSRHARDMQARRDVPLMGESALCGACHTEIRPPLVNGDEPMNLQETYDEWRRSPWAAQGVHCQDCHMARDPAATLAALKRGERKPRGVSHRIPGNNYLLADPDLPGQLMTALRGGSPTGVNRLFSREEYRDEQRRTRDQIVALLQQAGELRIDTGQAGAQKLAVVVSNTGAGHALPTGPLDQRHIWLEVQIVAADGKTVFHSGRFDAGKGHLDPAAVTWVKVMTDGEGKRDLRHLLFDSARLTYPRRPIPAGASDRVDYALPALAAGRYQVSARLWYRLAFQEILANLESQTGNRVDVVIPPLRLAESSAVLDIPATTTEKRHVARQ